MFQTGLLSEPAAGDIGWARVPLSRDPRRRRAARARRGRRRRPPAAAGERDRAGPDGGVRDRGERRADGARRCGDRRRARTIGVARLVPAAGRRRRAALARLGTSPIVNLHVVYDRRVLELPFAAGVDTPVQYVFDRTESAGARPRAVPGGVAVGGRRTRAR